MLKEKSWPKLDQCQVTAQDLTTLHIVHHISHNYPPGTWLGVFHEHRMLFNPLVNQDELDHLTRTPAWLLFQLQFTHFSVTEDSHFLAHTLSSVNNTGVPCVREPKCT